MVDGIVPQADPTIGMDRLRRTSANAEVEPANGAQTASVGRQVPAAPEQSDAGGYSASAKRSQPLRPENGQSSPAVAGQQIAAAVQDDPAITVPWTSLTLFTDPDTGTPVAIYRDKVTGEILRQVPENLARNMHLDPGQVSARMDAEREAAAEDVARTDKDQETGALDVSI